MHRYARDIIGCLNHWVAGWVDWNMVLDRQGGPNWFKNWCIAPVIVDPEQDEVYFTPLYDVMCHFSKFIRPGATVLANDCADADVMTVATENEDGSYTVVCFNQGDTGLHLEGCQRRPHRVDAQALQTVVLTLPNSKTTHHGLHLRSLFPWVKSVWLWHACQPNVPSGPRRVHHVGQDLDLQPFCGASSNSAGVFDDHRPGHGVHL